MAAERSHLNPGFKVVSHASPQRRHFLHVFTSAAGRSRVSPPTDRAALRKTLRERRRSLSPQQRIAAAEALAGRVLALPFLPASGYVAGYWAMDGEIGLHALQLRLPAQIGRAHV